MGTRLTSIDRHEALAYLGCRGEPPAELAEAVARCEAMLLRAARPRTVWKRLRRLADGTLAGTELRPAGEDVAALLAGCDEVVLMAATLGTEAEALIRRAQARSMSDAVVLDALASAAIERVCDDLCADIEAETAPLYLTDRFSPGYGDMPLTQQEALCRVLDTERRIGVTLTESGLMLPQKTVTAIMGLTHEPTQKRRKSCDTCNMREDCAFRKEGTSCGAY